MSEQPQVYQHDNPKALKTHKCYECSGTINIGEIYHNHHGIWDCKGGRFKVCSDCEELRAGLIKEWEPYEMFDFGDLEESVVDGRDPKIIEKWVAIKRKRGSVVQDWLKSYASELREKQEKH